MGRLKLEMEKSDLSKIIILFLILGIILYLIKDNLMEYLKLRAEVCPWCM